MSSTGAIIRRNINLSLYILGQVTEYTYDDRDNLLMVKDANNNITRFEYDRNNHLTKEIRPMGEETVYEYDGVGNLIEKEDAKGQKTLYPYDDTCKLIEINYYNPVDPVNPVKTVSFTYDKVGNLLTYDDGTTSGTYEYNVSNQKTSETVDYGAFNKSYQYTYYDNGQKKTFTGPDNITYTYTYDANNQLTGIQIPGQGSITYNAYEWNRPSSITYPGGSTKTFAYDPLMRIKQIISKRKG